MTTTDRLLISMLACTDALFAPCREWTNRHSHRFAQNLYQRRAAFAVFGVDWTGRSSDETDRKERQRQMDGLAASGEIVIARHRGRASGVRLSDETDTRMRAFLLLSTVYESHPTLQLAAKLNRRGPTNETKLYIDGGQHKPFRYDGPAEVVKEKILDVEDRCLPLLVRGWMTSHSDCHGSVDYDVTEAGMAAAKSTVEFDVESLPYDTDGESNALYVAEWKAWRDSWRKATPPHPHDIVIPLPASR